LRERILAVKRQWNADLVSVSWGGTPNPNLKVGD